MRTIDIEFFGPFGWRGDEGIPSIYSSDKELKPITSQGGVYLWTILTPDGDELVHYVGMTKRSFVTRFLEHQGEQSIGKYSVHDPDTFVLGRNDLLWRGTYGDGTKIDEHFVRRFEMIRPLVTRYMDIQRFHIAPISAGESRDMSYTRLLENVETGLACHFHHQPGIAGMFQEGDVVYRGHGRLSQIEWPVPNPTTRLECHTKCKIRGFPNDGILIW